MDMEISSAQQQAMARSNTQLMMESDQKQRRILGRPQPEQALKCPRCDSTNTKFCYYNNYSLSQPRYFCKGCRRYWTQGGSLRNVPVGGGCRKNNKRSTSSSSFKKPQDQALITPDTTIMNPLLPNVPLPFSHNPSDLTLALNRLQNPNDFLLRPSLNIYPNPNITGFLDILKSGFLDSTNYPSTSGLVNNACSSYNGTFDVGLSSTSTSTTASETVQGQFENNDTDVSHGVGVNSSRDYWNEAANTYWHGLMNSSLM